MAKLILSMDGLVLKEIPLTKERTTIGRKPHNDIQIDNLAVSGEHAVVVTILNDSFLEDLGSTNGTLVNGNAVKKHFLQNNDVIELGKYKLKYMAEAGQQPMASAADFERTMVLRPSGMKQTSVQARNMAAAGAAQSPAAEEERAAAERQASGAPSTPPPSFASMSESGVDTTPRLGGASRPGVDTTSPLTAVPPAAEASTFASGGAPQPTGASAPTAAPAQTRPAHPLGAIQILTGGNAGKELELAKPLTTLGKPGVQVAVLTRRPQGYFITHVEGAKNPNVNGESIGAAPHPLKDHDVIELAGVKMEFFLKG